MYLYEDTIHMVRVEVFCLEIASEERFPSYAFALAPKAGGETTCSAKVQKPNKHLVLLYIHLCKCVYVLRKKNNHPE